MRLPAFFFIIVYCVLGIISSAQAQCDYSLWISVWPSEKELKIQPRQVFLFSVSNYSPAKKEALQLGLSLEVYLWSAHDSVRLLVRDRVVNAQGDLTLLLRPERPLRLDDLYELRASHDGGNLFYVFKQNGPQHPGKRGTTAYKWRVTSTPDTKSPMWTATPAVLKKVYSENSEGVDNYVLFSYPLQDSSACLLKTTIRHERSGHQMSAYLLPWQGQLPVGWFTCGGDFKFESEEKYNVSFEAIDAAGNRATATGFPIPFLAPTKVSTGWH